LPSSASCAEIILSFFSCSALPFLQHATENKQKKKKKKPRQKKKKKKVGKQHKTKGFEKKIDY
jgi:prophage tail gpP-like protein